MLYYKTKYLYNLFLFLVLSYYVCTSLLRIYPTCVIAPFIKFKICKNAFVNVFFDRCYINKVQRTESTKMFLCLFSGLEMGLWLTLSWLILGGLSPPTPIWGNPDAKRLYDDLLSNYNRLIRPVGNNSDRLTVKMGLRLSQLIDVVNITLYFSFND